MADVGNGEGKKRHWTPNPTGENGPLTLTPQQLSAREGFDAAFIKDMTPQQVALFAAMLTNGGNITKAARQVGMNESYARRLASKHAVFREALRQYGHAMKTCLEDWTEIVPRAKATMISLLQDEDGKVRYLAAKDIIDRAEGKAINRMELNVKDERPQLTEGEVQLAFNLMKSKGISYPEAVALIKDHPEDAAQWIAANAVASLPAATVQQGPDGEVVDAQLLPDDEDRWRATAGAEESKDQGGG